MKRYVDEKRDRQTLKKDEDEKRDVCRCPAVSLCCRVGVCACVNSKRLRVCR